MTWIKPILAVLVFLALSVAAYWYVWVPGQSVTSLQVQSSTGEQIHIGGRNGKPMLINFWASSCQSCMEEIPHLIEIYHKWKSAGLEVVGVTVSYDPPLKAMEKAEQINITYPIVFDLDKKIQHHFSLRRAVTPVTILISQEGKITYQRIGKPDLPVLLEQIKKLMSHEIQPTVRKNYALG